MKGLEGLLAQAQQMQEKLQRAQQELAEAEVVGESGAGMVRVTMTGRHDVRRVQIDPALRQEEVSMLEDLLAAAVNDAVRRVEALNRDKLGSLGAGLPPGFKMPF